MPHINQLTVNCTTCNQPFPAQIRSYIDVNEDPEGKLLLLNGRLNANICPHCGNMNTVMASILYHDPDKELLVAHVPMELNIDNAQQERIIGNMMNTLPKENFKAYMFSPKRALTLKALTEMILEADGVTPEMMKEQEKRVEIAQELLSATNDERPALIEKYDDIINEQFFQVLAMMAQRMMEEGRPDMAQQVMVIQSQIAQLSTVGKALIEQQEKQEQTVREVANEIEALGANADRESFYELALNYMGDDERLQALIGLARPAFDYQFLQDMSVKIGQAPADEREDLTNLRDQIVELSNAIDQQSQKVMQNAAGFLQAALDHPQPEQFLQTNAHMVDDTLLQVLMANVQEAEKRGDVQSSAKLKEIYTFIVGLLEGQMQPELRFVNALLSTKSDDEAKIMIAEQAKGFGDELLEVMDAVNAILIQQGNQPLQDRLGELRKEVELVLA